MHISRYFSRYCKKCPEEIGENMTIFKGQKGLKMGVNSILVTQSLKFGTQGCVILFLGYKKWLTKNLVFFRPKLWFSTFKCNFLHIDAEYSYKKFDFPLMVTFLVHILVLLAKFQFSRLIFVGVVFSINMEKIAFKCRKAQFYPKRTKFFPKPIIGENRPFWGGNT